MQLVVAASQHEAELRADLQRVYAIDWDEARAGGHTVRHMAALVACLPQDACMRRAVNADAEWTLDRQLLAGIYNALNGLIWGMGDRRHRGPRPKPIGPSWATRGATRSLESRALAVDQLMDELSRPRTSKREVS